VPLSGGRLQRSIASLSGVAGLRCRENPRRAQARRRDDLGIGGLASRPTSYKSDGWCAIGLSRKLSRLADAAFQVVGQVRPTHYCSLDLTRGLTGPYLLDFTVFWGLAVCFALPERFALPVCTTVVPLLFPEAAPNAAPAAAPFATGWVFCCSSAGGGGGGGGGCFLWQAPRNRIAPSANTRATHLDDRCFIFSPCESC